MFFNSEENILSVCVCVYLCGKGTPSSGSIYIFVYILLKEKKKKSFGFACSGGDIGEPGIFSKRKQLGTVSIRVHALLSFQISQQCHKFHGDSFPFGSPWGLPI